MDDKHCRRLAHKLGATVAAVEYRLAPGHPYPAALEDCLAALERLAREPTVDSSRIAVAGASAGGGIGVGTLDILHDEAVDYAKRLAAADVPCALEVVSGAFHGFDPVAPKTALAQSFIASHLSFLRRAFDSV